MWVDIIERLASLNRSVDAVNRSADAVPALSRHAPKRFLRVEVGCSVVIAGGGKFKIVCSSDEIV